ncbi:myc target protein 1 homolog [Aplochiton taeniatus]
MAVNETNPFLEILKTFDLGNLILAFCLSMVVGLLIGALIYILLTWLSRRRASARITRPTKQWSGSSRKQNPMHNRSGLYRHSDNAMITVYRQPSVEPVGPIGCKPSSEASTFRPLPKGRKAGQESGPDRKASLPNDTMASNSSDSTSAASLVAGKRNSFWLGNNGLKGFLPMQTPPPTYNSVIHDFEETCT